MNSKPLICFMGDKARCRDIMRNLNSSAKSIYIDKHISKSHKMAHNLPWLFCIVPGAGDRNYRLNYSKIIKYSLKSKCPVYAICTPTQLKEIRRTCKEIEINQVTQTELKRIIREIRNRIIESGNRLEAFKNKMETVSIISSNPALTAFSIERSITDASSRRAVIISAVFEECAEALIFSQKPDSYIITDNADYSEPVQIKEIAAILPEDDTPAFYVGNDEKKKSPKNVRYVSIRSQRNIIGTTLKKRSDMK